MTDPLSPRTPRARALPAWLFAIRGRPPAGVALALGLVPVLVLFALWWWATRGEVEERVISYVVLPSPAEVWRAIPDLFASAGLDEQIVVSLKRVLISYLWALAIAVPLGVAMGAFGSVGATFSPLATASSYIPIATLVPLTMSWFGTGDLAKEFFLAMAFGISLLPAIVKAIESVPDVYLRTAYTLGATRTQAVFRVLIPIAAPDMWHGMRLSFGVGWTYLTIAEALSYDGGGLGALVEVSRRLGKRERIYITIAVITLIAWMFDLAWRKAGHLLFRYQRTRA